MILVVIQRAVGKICTDTTDSSSIRPKTNRFMETVGETLKIPLLTEGPNNDYYVGTISEFPPSPVPKEDLFLVDLTNCQSYRYIFYQLYIAIPIQKDSLYLPTMRNGPVKTYLMLVMVYDDVDMEPLEMMNVIGH